MRIVKKGIVWDNPKPYLETRHSMHPTFINVGNNEFVCAHDIGSAPEAMDYQTWLSRSTDGGNLWTLEGPINREIVDRQTTSMVRISKTLSGLVGLGARIYRDDPSTGILNRENLGYAPMDLILLRSGDNGKSWSLPETIEPPLVGPAFEVSHKIVELSNGNWIAPMATWRGWDGALPNGEKSVVLISDDQGKSFPDYGVCFDGTKEGVIHWEQSVVELDNGVLLSVAWVYHPESGKHLPNRFTYSVDGGKTFADSQEIGIDGQTCKICKLRNGRLLLVYRRNDSPGLWSQLAFWDGERMILEERLPLWGTQLSTSGMTGTSVNSDELSALKFGYPQSEQLEDGTVFLVFWAFEDWNCKIHYIKLEM